MGCTRAFAEGPHRNRSVDPMVTGSLGRLYGGGMVRERDGAEDVGGEAKLCAALGQASDPLERTYSPCHVVTAAPV